MGKKHRDNRKAIKAMLPRGWRENEYGELVKKISKADARKVLLGRYIQFRKLFKYAENDIINLATKRASDSITAIEDARIIGEIHEAYNSLSE